MLFIVCAAVLVAIVFAAVSFLHREPEHNSDPTPTFNESDSNPTSHEQPSVPAENGAVDEPLHNDDDEIQHEQPLQTPSENTENEDIKTDAEPEPMLPTEPERQEPVKEQPKEQPSVPTYSAADDPAAHIPQTADAEWNMILVNPWNKLPDDFEVKLTQLKNGHSVDERAYPDLQQMMDDARAAGLAPIICSSYRTNAKQTTLFTNQVNSYLSRGYEYDDAIAEAGKWVAVPGTSEHQTGLAVDIVATSYQILDEAQEDTAEQKWLMENSYKYGWILRYPSDKSELTGIYYEPWHYRYVGKSAAQEIYEKGICFEEYLAIINIE